MNKMIFLLGFTWCFSQTCNLESTTQNNALIRAMRIIKVILISKTSNIIHKRELLFKEMYLCWEEKISTSSYRWFIDERISEPVWEALLWASSCVVCRSRKRGKCLGGTNGRCVDFNILKRKFSFRHFKKLY